MVREVGQETGAEPSHRGNNRVLRRSVQDRVEVGGVQLGQAESIQVCARERKPVAGFDRRAGNRPYRSVALAPSSKRVHGTPAEQVDGMRRAPFWPGMEAVAPTLAYDHAAILGEPWPVPAELAMRVSVPALVMAGDASLPFMPDAARVLSQAIPQGQLRTLEGQTHEVNPDVLAPVLTEFLTQ